MPLASAVPFEFDYNFTDTTSDIGTDTHYINLTMPGSFTYHQYADWYVTLSDGSTYQTVKILYAVSPYQLQIYDDISYSIGDTVWIHEKYEINNPIIISNVNQLQFIENITTANYTMNQSFDASSINFEPIEDFKGTFDGMGYTISNFVCEHPSDDYVALFGTAYNATIGNFTMSNVSVDGDQWVAPVVSYGEDVYIHDIYIDGYIEGTVNVGGVTGLLRYGSYVYRCISDVDIYSTGSGSYAISGGISSYLRDGSIIEQCASYGDLDSDDDRNGGIAGQIVESSSIIDSYSRMNVTGVSYNAGAVGLMSDSTITNFFYAGNVTGTLNTNGIAAGYDNTVTYSYYDNNISDVTSDYGTAKTTAQMLLQSTYSTWDFDDVWYMEGYPILQFEGLDYTYDPVIVYPTNGTEIASDYPALTDINFAWTEYSGAPSSSYQLSRDSNYNTLVSSGTTTNFYKTLSLDADDYYFRVRYLYDTGMYSDWTETQFLINATYIDYGTAVQGVVYESVSGSQTALSGSKVTIYSIDGDFSDDYITGENGFYLFENLDMDNYGLIASKDGYETSQVNYVNVTDAITYTKDIALEEENAPTYITPHYVQFIVKSWNQYYEGVTVTVYIGDSATAYKTLTTGSDGACGAELSEDTRYRVTAYLSGVINSEEYITPTDDTYIFYVDIDDMLLDLVRANPNSKTVAVETSVSTTEINDTHAIINVNYEDTMDETINLMFNITQSIDGDPENVTSVASVNLGTTNNTSYNFTISGYDGESYYVSITADHTTFGTISRLYGVQFEDSTSQFGLAKEIIGWIALFILFWWMSSASQYNVPETAIGVVLLATCMKYLFDWGIFINGAGLAMAWLVALAANFARGKEREA